jgi:hypothetical protein
MARGPRAGASKVRHVDIALRGKDVPALLNLAEGLKGGHASRPVAARYGLASMFDRGAKQHAARRGWHGRWAIAGTLLSGLSDKQI